MLISLSSVGFGYGDNLIIQGVAFAVNEGERVGLVGDNGAGKTTLIKLMLGRLLPDSGEVIKKNGVRIGYLEQNGGYESGNTVYAEMRAVFGEEIAAVERLASLNAELVDCEYGGKEYKILSAKIEALNKFVASRDCYNVDVKIKTVLNGMGFENFYDRVIDTMSGGEKTRLRLARLLLESPDLLVLDEPTNHLDVKTLYWLEDYLSAFRGAVFVVSHDRYFLDRTVTKILEIENKRLNAYAGNYSKYKILKAERYERALKEYEKQQEEIKKLQTYVDKNIVRATTAKSAQSRVKQLERMDVLEKPYLPPRPPKFSFTYSQQSAKEVLTICGLNLGIGGKSLIVGGQLQILRGEKVAILGENGAGKSTLLRAIVGGDPAITLGRYVKIAYYDQEMANLNGENTVQAELWERHVSYSLTEVRSSLARCGLSAEDVDKKVSSLSGGERAKLALCVFENACGNVLVLDEPTNHLDLPARESLEDALKNFDGTVIFVSHDRYFISAVAERIVEIEDRALKAYGGGYEGYKKAKAEAAEGERRKEEEARRREAEEERAKSYRSKRERAAEANRRAELKAVEAEISALEEREAEINARLSDPEVTGDYKKLSEAVAELEKTRGDLEKLYERYGQLID
ncbi:MAG: ABC-F family ATP-binding cassette domain-containing protein [Clostridiales bacterium]|nr:ABC-F family ATP-binding cassette domain-containing protein [Clostridiales bacterium]